MFNIFKKRAKFTDKDYEDITYWLYHGYSIWEIKEGINNRLFHRRQRLLNKKKAIRLVKAIIEYPRAKSCGVGNYVNEKVSKLVWWRLL